MRKITQEVTTAFLNGYKKTIGNTYTDGTALYLHGNKIAEKTEEGLRISNAGWASVTTKERLNALPNVSICQKNFTWYLNGIEWGGEWVTIKTN